jgi:hypothetical protein
LSCPRCGLAQVGLSACPRCLLAGLDEPEPLPENPPGLELVEEIGRGGMGRVFRARHLRLERDVAVKLLPLELAADPAFQARFTREARTLARLDHPSLVTVHDFGTLSDGSSYLVMEYVSGGTLRSRMPLSIDAAERALRELCSALSYAHARGVVHRDIKPENVLFDADGRAKLADFGIARLVADEHTALTAPLAVLGTPRYMPPEARAGAPADARADIFALGVMLRDMLGESPHGARAGRLLAIAERAAQNEPSARFTSVAALETALETGVAPAALPAEEQSFLRAVALTLAGATAVSLFACLRSVTPRVLEPSEALPFIMFEAQRLADGRVATRARFETWPTLGAAAAWVVAIAAYGLLRVHWRRAALVEHAPERPLAGTRHVVRMAIFLNALFGLHLLLEVTALRSALIYLPILGGVLELAMVYLVWSAVLEAFRSGRPLRREPWLWVAAVMCVIPPGISALRRFF